MGKITKIEQLKAGDKIWTINCFTGHVDIMEFVCIHPHNSEYSIFLNENYDGMPKFYNKHLMDADYELYDASDECWNRIHQAEIDWHLSKISHIKERNCINVEYIKNKPLDFDAEFAKFIDKIENELCHKLPDAELFRLRACAKHFSLL